MTVLEALDRFVPRACDADMFEPGVIEQLRAQIAFYPSFAFPSVESPTVLCGFVHGHGVGEAWMVTGAGFERTARQVLRQQRDLCALMYRTLGLHRMHIMVDADRPDAIRWAQSLGFEYETRLKRMSAKGLDELVYLWPHN